MFNFEGFGQRLQQLRKKKSMTQEDLADRMGVTGQAVSKWETGLSYPDITIIPALATVLGTEIDFLFGKEVKERNIINDFPEAYGGLPRVHIADGVACYSNKEVASTDETGVKFADGSTAELSTMLATNTGQGEIKFFRGNALRVEDSFDTTISEKVYEFDYIDSVDINIIYSDCKIVRSHDGRTKVTAKGDAKFLSLVTIEASDNTLKIGWGQDMNYNMRKQFNTIVVEMPCEMGEEAKIKITGSGMVTSELDFRAGKLNVNGSGGITVRNFSETCKVGINGSGAVDALHTPELNLGISGSGDIKWKSSDKAKISINGSGCISLESAETARVDINGSGSVDIKQLVGGGDFTTKILGSGAINMKEGSCQKFDVNILGSGEIDATGITARRANIALHTDGDVTLGRVTEGSTEQIKQKGSITILKRG